MPYSGLNTLRTNSKNHSFVRPPMSMPGSPVNCTLTFFFRLLFL